MSSAFTDSGLYAALLTECVSVFTFVYLEATVQGEMDATHYFVTHCSLAASAVDNAVNKAECNVDQCLTMSGTLILRDRFGSLRLLLGRHRRCDGHGRLIAAHMSRCISLGRPSIDLWHLTLPSLAELHTLLHDSINQFDVRYMWPASRNC